MTQIKLTPETLMQQSNEMASLQTEYESLFSHATSILNNLNTCWSETLANNFAGKIEGAQKDFSSIGNMLTNGSAAARVSALTLDHSGGVGNVLASLLGMTNGNESLASLMKNNSDLSKWITENSDKLTSGGAEIIGELSGLGGANAKTIESIVSKMTSGDYEGALSEAGDEVIDLYSGALAGGVSDSDLVSKLDEKTGGALSLAKLPKTYFKNWLKSTSSNAADIIKDQYSSNPDYGYEAKKLGEFAWNATAGSVLKTANDEAFKLMKTYCPETAKYYASQGANDGEGAVNVMLHDLAYSVTGNKETADYYGNYYKKNGGIASGIANGVTDIVDYAYHNILKK